MKLLVIGREGQLARALAEKKTDRISITCLGRGALDIIDRDTIERAIVAHRPEIVVNAAAYTAVDKAESEPDQAFAINRDGAGYVAAAAAAAGLPVVHLSTDYVFSGDKPTPYSEADPTGPASVYGRSKLAGELAVAEANPAHVILRTAWVYSPWGNNFAKTMLRLAEKRETIKVVSDQQGTPTYAPDIADGILTVARSVLGSSQDGSWRGTFHMTAQGATTWAGFAEALFAASAAIGGPYAAILPITTAEYPTAARRPANSQLDTSKFQTVFRYALPQWHESIAEWASRQISGKSNEIEGPRG